MISKFGIGILNTFMRFIITEVKQASYLNGFLLELLKHPHNPVVRLTCIAFTHNNPHTEKIIKWFSALLQYYPLSLYVLNIALNVRGAVLLWGL